jgi:mannose-1-phosphate guanylyltransferase
MKIRPVILCGGSGTRLWPNKKNHQAKQFINFGNWTLFGKTLDRIKNTLFDSPIISTNKKYLNDVKKHLKEKKIKKFKIILEPIKKNTAPAILSSTLIKDIPDNQPLVFLSSDHFIEKTNQFYKSISFFNKMI